MAKKIHPMVVAKRMAYTIVSSRFFIISVVVHVLAIALLGVIVIVDGFVEPAKDDFQSTDNFITRDVTPPPPPPDNEHEVKVKDTEIAAPVKPPDVSQIIEANNVKAPGFMPPIPVDSTVAVNTDKMVNPVVKTNPTRSNSPTKPISKDRLSLIAGRIAGENGINVKSGNNGVGGVSAQFTCYVAKYAGMIGIIM